LAGFLLFVIALLSQTELKGEHEGNHFLLSVNSEAQKKKLQHGATVPEQGTSTLTP
jgi:hypothetical protein